MTVQSIAILLLLIRLVSILFVVAVMYRQYRLFKLSIHSELITFRAVMMMLGIIFFFGHVLPIATDVYYGFLHDGSGEMNLLVYYAVSNAVTALVASILLWNIYRIAGKELEAKQAEADAE